MTVQLWTNSRPSTSCVSLASYLAVRCLLHLFVRCLPLRIALLFLNVHSSLDVSSVLNSVNLRAHFISSNTSIPVPSLLICLITHCQHYHSALASHPLSSRPSLHRPGRSHCRRAQPVHQLGHVVSVCRAASSGTHPGQGSRAAVPVPRMSPDLRPSRHFAFPYRRER
jgi:hypothetical protein